MANWVSLSIYVIYLEEDDHMDEESLSDIIEILVDESTILHEVDESPKIERI
jgi:hypothetical protein